MSDVSQASIPSLVSTLASQSSQLVRQEIQLAKAEMTERAVDAAKGGASIGAGGVVAFCGLLVLMAAAAVALALVMPAWLATLLVALAALAVGGMMLLKGKNRIASLDPVPHRTIETVKDDVRFATGADARDARRDEVEAAVVASNADPTGHAHRTTDDLGRS
ncbi:MAG TPA: phage holin family protein [Azospirillaceae bacterium]|nr:phage holin family protein [Azospirillaceae bacterium]